MSSNYPYDPKQAASIGNPATPQSGPGGTEPEFPLPAGGAQPLAQNPVSGPPSSASGSASASSSYAGVATNGNDHRRLAAGIELSSGRYRIEKLVAAGGMGAVYRALDTRFNRPCAVKEMLDEFQSDGDRTQAVEWFGREATLLLDLNHPCIPRVRDFFVESGRHYLVMDFIEGRTLGELLEKEGNVAGLNGARGVSEARARSWGQQICSVLNYIHNLTPPIIFRDLKPSNIMVTTRDEVKLIDFGIARTFQSQQQATIIMTIGYAPPEQLHGMPEPRSDIYALGATLHRLLTHHDAANNKPSIFSFPPVRTLRPDISPAFEGVVMKALAPVLEQRWRSAGEMERAIINLPSIVATPPVNTFAGPGALRPANQQTPSRVMAPVGTVAGNVPSQPSQLVPPPTQATIGTTGPGGQHIIAALGFLNSGQIEAAYTAVQRGYAVEPNNAMVHRIFGQVFARRQPPAIEQAMQAYAKSLQLNPNDAETHKLIGDVWLFLRRQPVQAIPEYTQSLRLKPNDVEAHQRLGQCYEETNQLEPALREYQEAARLAGRQPGLFYKIGQIATRLNQLPVAERAYVQVLTLDAANHQARFLLSQVYENEGKLEDAWRECGYIIGPLSSNPVMKDAVQALYQRLKSRLGR
ncbi:MAG TPA: serine/threonine-protein kinase [Ktedonobacteraceae bacterium]|nr:serine/threonine-protein kinase [Ktedonobacteraceae bacterium]